MGTTIFFRLDKSHSEVKSVCTYVSSGAWDSLGEILDKSLLPMYSDIHSIIKCEEGQYYSFMELDREKFNIAINAVRKYITSLEHPSSIEEYGIDAWKECVEPYLISDARYALGKIE